MNHNLLSRRPIRSRQWRIASIVAGFLAKKGMQPNQLSLLSIFFAALAALCLLMGARFENSAQSFLFICSAIFILLRLLCNLFDGMLAIEHNSASCFGEIYNDLPDRPSDLLIIVSAGYTADVVSGAVLLGWLAAVAAVMTAYVRLLGNTAGAPQSFIGPMAKQQRMAVMIVACVIAAFRFYPHFYASIFVISLSIILIGSLITIVRRLQLILKHLNSGSKNAL